MSATTLAPAASAVTTARRVGELRRQRAVERVDKLADRRGRPRTARRGSRARAGRRRRATTHRRSAVCPLARRRRDVGATAAPSRRSSRVPVAAAPVTVARDAALAQAHPAAVAVGHVGLAAGPSATPCARRRARDRGELVGRGGAAGAGRLSARVGSLRARRRRIDAIAAMPTARAIACDGRKLVSRARPQLPVAAAPRCQLRSGTPGAAAALPPGAGRIVALLPSTCSRQPCRAPSRSRTRAARRASCALIAHATAARFEPPRQRRTSPSRPAVVLRFSVPSRCCMLSSALRQSSGVGLSQPPSRSQGPWRANERSDARHDHSFGADSSSWRARSRSWPVSISRHWPSIRIGSMRVPPIDQLLPEVGEIRVAVARRALERLLVAAGEARGERIERRRRRSPRRARRAASSPMNSPIASGTGRAFLPTRATEPSGMRSETSPSSSGCWSRPT